MTNTKATVQAGNMAFPPKPLVGRARIAVLVEPRPDMPKPLATPKSYKQFSARGYSAYRKKGKR